jgi:5-methylcytosine-specific restriction enzyme A
MPKLRTLGPRLRSAAPLVRLPPKQKASIYNTPEFQAWRAAVIARAAGRCEAVDRFGHRCSKAAPHHRVYADHIVELRDGGHPFDVANGQALCASHHTMKTMVARARRLQSQNL